MRIQSSLSTATALWLFSLATLSLLVVTAEAATCFESGYACLRDQADLEEEGKWIFIQIPKCGEEVPAKTGKFGYARNSTELPGPLEGKLDGDGIFYFQGPLINTVAQGLAVYLGAAHQHDTLPSPAFLYVKYYGHVQTDNPELSAKMVAVPALHGNDQYADRHILHPTNFFLWGEEIVELNVTDLQFFINVHTEEFVDSDYFLLDTLILTYGLPVESVSDMVQLCPPRELPPNYKPVDRFGYGPFAK